MMRQSEVYSRNVRGAKQFIDPSQPFQQRHLGRADVTTFRIYNSLQLDWGLVCSQRVKKCDCHCSLRWGRVGLWLGGRLTSCRRLGHIYPTFLIFSSSSSVVVSLSLIQWIRQFAAFRVVFTIALRLLSLLFLSFEHGYLLLPGRSSPR